MKTRNLLLATGAIALSGNVNAAGVNPGANKVWEYLDHSNKQQKIEQGVDYLKVVIKDGEDGDIDFLIRTLPALDELAAGKRGPRIRTFSFNFGTSGADFQNLELPKGWAVKEVTKGQPFGSFDVTLRARPKAAGRSLKFSITDVEGDRPEDYLTELSGSDAKLGNYLFQAKVKGLRLKPAYDHCVIADHLGDDRKKVPGCNGRQLGNGAKFAGGTDVVPLPPAVLLFGSALLGLFGIRRGTLKQH